MLRKLFLAIAGTMLLSGAAAAQSNSPFPMSDNETGVYQPEPYLKPAATGGIAGPVAAQSSTFPTSVSEVGSNFPDPSTSATRVATGSQPSHDEMLRRSEFGSASQPAAAEKTVQVRASTEYVNVNHFETVRLVDGKGHSFAWRFDTLEETHSPLQRIAPRGFDAAHAEVYVRHPLSHLSND